MRFHSLTTLQEGSASHQAPALITCRTAELLPSPISSLWRTEYCMFDLLNEAMKTFGCFKAKISFISLMTADVAVAVTAATGTSGKSSLRFARAR